MVERFVAGFWRFAPVVAGGLVLAAVFLWSAVVAVRDPDRSSGDWLALLISGPFAGLATFGGLYLMFLVTRRADRAKESRELAAKSAAAMLSATHDFRHALRGGDATQEHIEFARESTRFAGYMGSEHYLMAAWLMDAAAAAVAAHEDLGVESAVETLDYVSTGLVVWMTDNFMDDEVIELARANAPAWVKFRDL